MQHKVIGNLKKLLDKPLPGKKVQFTMAPDDRSNLDEQKIEEKNPAIAAVMLLLFQESNQWKIPLILRATYNGVHSNQISFPGGRVEPQDKSLQNTALRETEEEIGIEPHGIKLLGGLSTLYIPPSNFMVYPFVGYIEKKIEFKKQVKEVKEIIRHPIADLLDESKKMTINDNYPAYKVGELNLWGATAMIMAEFLYLWRKLPNILDL